MTQPTYQIPILGNPSSSEDPKIHDALAQIETILTGNVDASNLADGAVTSAKLATTPAGIATANVQNVATNSFVTVVFAMEDYDTDNMVDLGTHNDRITINTPGLFVAEARIRHIYNADSDRRLSNIVHFRGGSAINGSNDSRVNVGNAGGGGDTIVSVTQVIGCLAGDYFQVQVYQDSGGTTTMDGHLAVARIGST